MTDLAKSELRAWLEIAGFDCPVSIEQKLLAAVRAASRVADDTPPEVRVNLAMFDDRDARWIKLDISRLEI